MKFIRSILAGIVSVYQYTLSPDHGPLKYFFPAGYCKYHPSCSEYTKQALLKHGVAKGLGLGVWRIIRCNPWSKGGKDLVP